MNAKRFMYLSIGAMALAVAFAAIFQSAGRSAVAAPAAPVTPAVAEQLQNDFAAVASKVNPAVVNIDVERPVSQPQGYQFWQGPGEAMPPQFRQFFNFPFGPDFGSPDDQGDNGGMSAPPRQRGRRGNPGGGNRGNDVPKAMAAGSGFIVDAAKGYIVTNAHVAKDATHIGVTVFDGSSYDAKLIGYDPRTDVAVVQISGAKGLQEIEFADSDQVKIGHICLAFGQPEGLKYTVTQGIISATGRSDLGIIGGSDGIAGYESFLQTDAAVNPGNSGGPLVNIYGQVIGMNTAIATAGVPQFGGISFAIPSNIITKVIPKLIDKGEVVYGWIGVAMRPSDQTAETLKKYGDVKGVYVSAVEPGQPADTAGMKAGDVIMSFAGKSVPDTTTLRLLVGDAAVGGTAPVEVVRLEDGKPHKMTIDVKVAKQPKSLASVSGGPVQTKIGLHVQTLTPDIADSVGVSADTKGAIVSDVDPDSRADKAGLQPYDIITQVKYKNKSYDIASSGDLSDAISRVPAADSFSVRVIRDGAAEVVAIK